LLAEIEINRGQYAAALDLLSNALKIYPRHYPLTMLMAEALINNSQADEARRLLLDQIYYRNPTPTLYQLFAKATGQAGFPAESHEALAEYHYQQGAVAAAINQIDAALKVADNNNFHLISRLEARKKEFTYELKLRTQEK
jgi:predicted Zn-dependent protease